jgi:hypothetical protein
MSRAKRSGRAAAAARLRPVLHDMELDVDATRWRFYRDLAVDALEAQGIYGWASALRETGLGARIDDRWCFDHVRNLLVECIAMLNYYRAGASA